jgi:large subunit ribosomal protein L3
MGGDTVTQKGLKIVRIDAERNLLLIDGSVPGPNGAVVIINKVGGK